MIKQNKIYNQKDDFYNELTLEELNGAIKSLDPKKSPVIDLIFGSMIRHVGALTRRVLSSRFSIYPEILVNCPLFGKCLSSSQFLNLARAPKALKITGLYP
ncbi:hypothetical protein TNIN_95271 [Trichonephila inaurata madagascariensis]|uniref:Uncharacterized protein n=1 Tax=Trichonephila inaurata madagascariensis TaxID=2747483 RepID=A0A8X6YXA2_9ARAC|nr:hypothetical protein TNIN_95271 [Trichonephila inaurata madagascariensis]